MKVEEFIKDSYLNFRKVVCVSPYYSFGLICAGIEFLGKCLDEKREWHVFEPGLSRNQFNEALRQLMPEYLQISGSLYSDVRCGMLHALIPKKGIWLREKHNTIFPHLSEQNIHDIDMTVIIIEDFYSDYQKACDNMIYRIQNKEFKHAKMNRPFLETKE